MGIHRDLCELVAAAGPDVLLDATEFRAALDDFLDEGAASEGELNLLTDAVRLGSLQRVVDQIAHGADPELAIVAQADRLAEQRGTREAEGARWALGALAHALGHVDEPVVLGPTEQGAADQATVLPQRPLLTPVPSASPPTVLPPPTALPPLTQSKARPDVLVEADAVVRPGRARRLWVLFAAGSAVALTAAGVVLWREVPDEREPSGGAVPGESSVLTSGEIRAIPAASVPEAAEPAVMASRDGGVQVTGFGSVEKVVADEVALISAADEELVAFTLADGPCQAQPACLPWEQLALEVVVGDATVLLPAGGPSFVIAAGTDDAVQLRLTMNGYDQRIALRDGRPGDENIEVLTRAVRTVDVGESRVVPVTSNLLLEPGAARWTVSVGRAELSFFIGAKGLADPGKAYLDIEVSYLAGNDDSGEPSYVGFDNIVLRGPGNQEYERRDIQPDRISDTVFVVPADLTRATLVLRGERRLPTAENEVVVLTIPSTPIPIRFPAK
ncbi:hypothetical protein [Nocardioides sp. Root190]|uniref:hypothetical protein n=1 Tax=Nocardioides sp. Root190 TaxID=1736488 RepID=UPI0012FC43F1|nr:hypothetical protein [Nocardioides sp. Root190]